MENVFVCVKSGGNKLREIFVACHGNRPENVQIGNITQIIFDMI